MGSHTDTSTPCPPPPSHHWRSGWVVARKSHGERGFPTELCIASSVRCPQTGVKRGEPPPKSSIIQSSGISEVRIWRPSTHSSIGHVNPPPPRTAAASAEETKSFLKSEQTGLPVVLLNWLTGRNSKAGHQTHSQPQAPADRVRDAPRPKQRDSSGGGRTPQALCSLAYRLTHKCFATQTPPGLKIPLERAGPSLQTTCRTHHASQITAAGEPAAIRIRCLPRRCLPSSHLPNRAVKSHLTFRFPPPLGHPRKDGDIPDACEVTAKPQPSGLM